MGEDKNALEREVACLTRLNELENNKFTEQKKKFKRIQAETQVMISNDHTRQVANLNKIEQLDYDLKYARLQLGYARDDNARLYKQVDNLKNEIAQLETLRQLDQLNQTDQ